MPIATPSLPTTPLAANKPNKPAVPLQAEAPAKHPKNRIRTVLIASHGWPTDAAQPAKKRVAKR